MKKYFIQKQKGGYTLIETMIAVALFLIIVTIGMGALLNASLLHNKSKDLRSIMDNLSFVMDDMSRNLRTGYDYSCINSGIPGPYGPLLPNPSVPTADNQNCWGIEFEPSGGGAPWAYEIVTQTVPTQAWFIEKTTDGGNTWVQLTPSEVQIDTVHSNFAIIGALPPPDTEQPYVTVHLSGTITYQKIMTTFSLQTTVSQRQIDI